MNLMDLYERQQQEIDRFKVLRDQVWQKVLNENEKLVAAFGDKETLNTDAKALYNGRIDAFNVEWSLDNGTRYRDMLNEHKKQIQQITGKTEQEQSPDEKEVLPRKEKTENTTKEKFKGDSERMTDKNVDTVQPNKNEETEKKFLKEKIAKQQAAIKARKIQKKRGR